MAIPRYTDSLVNYDRLNNRVTAKADQAVDLLVAEMQRLGITFSTKESLKNVKARLVKKDFMINRIRFRFKKSGVFVHKGVGRGTTMAEVGSTNRKAKEWFNPIIEKVADEIAEIAADELVEITFKRLKIY